MMVMFWVTPIIIELSKSSFFTMDWNLSMVIIHYILQIILKLNNLIGIECLYQMENGDIIKGNKNYDFFIKDNSK